MNRSTFFDLMMVEANGGDGVLVEGAVGDSFDKGGFACILKSDDGDFEFLIEKPAFDPIDDFIEEANHEKIIRLFRIIYRY